MNVYPSATLPASPHLSPVVSKASGSPAYPNPEPRKPDIGLTSPHREARHCPTATNGPASRNQAQGRARPQGPPSAERGAGAEDPEDGGGGRGEEREKEPQSQKKRPTTTKPRPHTTAPPPPGRRGRGSGGGAGRGGDESGGPRGEVTAAAPADGAAPTAGRGGSRRPAEQGRATAGGGDGGRGRRDAQQGLERG